MGSLARAALEVLARRGEVRIVDPAEVTERTQQLRGFGHVAAVFVLGTPGLSDAKAAPEFALVLALGVPVLMKAIER